jgi:hypothetical protein
VTPTDRSLALGFILSTIGAALTLATWHQLTRAARDPRRPLRLRLHADVSATHKP